MVHRFRLMVDLDLPKPYRFRIIERQQTVDGPRDRLTTVVFEKYSTARMMVRQLNKEEESKDE
jgi:hypothetical protein